MQMWKLRNSMIERVYRYFKIIICCSQVKTNNNNTVIEYIYYIYYIYNRNISVIKKKTKVTFLKLSLKIYIYI